jgi:hypothetical protein
MLKDFSSRYDTNSGNFTPGLVPAWDATSNRIVYFGYEEYASMTFRRVVVNVAISGTTLTVGTIAVVDYTNYSGAGSIIYSPGFGKCIASYPMPSGPAKFVFFTISGNTTTVSSSYNTTTASATQSSLIAGSGNEFYALENSKLVRYTISGTTFSIVGSINTANYSGAQTKLIYDSINDAVVIFSNNSPYYPTYSVTYSWNSTLAAFISGTTDIFNNDVYMIFRDIFYSSYYGKIIAFFSGNDNLHNYQVITPYSSNLLKNIPIGIAQQPATNGGQVSVLTLGGIDKNKLGLTINNTYYVDGFGNLTTSNTSPNVLLGRAVSANNILITKGVI